LGLLFFLNDDYANEQAEQAETQKETKKKIEQAIAAE